MMHEREQSDSSVVPGKPPNKAGASAAEVVEGRGLAKGNLREQNTPRTQSRRSVLSALERVREAAQQDGRQRFTALLHHIYDPERLRAAYFDLKRTAAAGVDAETWHAHLRENEEGKVHCAASDDAQAHAGKAEGSQAGASATDA